MFGKKSLTWRRKKWISHSQKLPMTSQMFRISFKTLYILKYEIISSPCVSSGTNTCEDVPGGETGTGSPSPSTWEYVDDPLPPVRHKFTHM